MTFQCHDLDRALESQELMPLARVHAEGCPSCREQLELWNKISMAAPGLHQDWESPYLWTRIRAELGAAPSRKTVPWWRWAVGIAAALVVAAVLWQPWSGLRASRGELLTEEALHEVQEAESVYARSIAKLQAAAGPSLDRPASPLADAYREKLMVLDSAIADLKTNIETNRFNPYLQTELASLYREKQKTLEEWLHHAKQS